MKIILDCDTGVDDVVAVAYALASPEAEVVGIGSVHGNIESDVAAENTLKLLALMGRPEIPVAVGADRPLLRPVSYAKFIHGDDGIGDTNMPPSGLQPTGEHAADQIVRLAREYPGEISLVPTSPLTNIALALMKEPELPSLIREVVLMGGAVTYPGNVSPLGEANIWHDPEAAKLVFDAPWRITMAPLDVTMHTLLEEEHLRRWRAADTPLTRWLLRVTEFYLGAYLGILGRRGCAMHDAVAVGQALGLVQDEESHVLPVTVSTQDGPALGQTVVDRRPLVNRSVVVEDAHTRVMMKIDGESFVDDLVERIAAYRTPSASAS